MSAAFSVDCRRCSRLAEFLAEVRDRHPDYFARPVPSFGDPAARLLIVGLAPGMHGANATGRPFTGDYAGLLLYRTLHEFGFASAPESRAADDGLQLLDCRITNAVRCLPPQNKPTTVEVNTCNNYLKAELSAGRAPTSSWPWAGWRIGPCCARWVAGCRPIPSATGPGTSRPARCS